MPRGKGVLYDRFGRDAIVGLGDLRRTNLLRLAYQLDPDAAHAEQGLESAVSIR